MKPARAPLRKAALLELMTLEGWLMDQGSVRCSRWFSQHEIISVGGLRAPARLSEIRRDGQLTYDVMAVDDEAGEYRYRLREWLPGEPRPVRRVSRLKQLEAEVERLNSELSKLRRVMVPVSENLDLLLECRVAEVGP